ncbi:hypothetical protein FQR65_LT06009 [Abscondita terminalis]|nr:hypothetical protein FQR65_LT06009 [Abscondita terminalis]
MKIRKLSPELQKIANAELNEDSNRIENDLRSFREWLKFQKHLNFRDEDQFLIAFLRGCKFSIETAKQKIDYYYMSKTLTPEFFKGRSPLNGEIQKILKNQLVTFYHTQPTLPVVVYGDWSNLEKHKIEMEDIIRHYFMASDYLLVEEDSYSINGVVIIVNCKDIPLKYLLQCSIPTIKQYFLIIQNGFPVRIKGFYVINAPAYLDTMYKLCEIVLSDKIKQRIQIYSKENSHKLLEIVPKDLIPNELGGKAGTLVDLSVLINMDVRELSYDLQQKAIKELNEDPKRVQQDIEDLRIWLKCQPHLKIKDESFYVSKTFAPEIFTNRNPFKNSIQALLSSKTIFVNTLSFPMVSCVSWRYIESMKISLGDVVQLASMLLDILINENDKFIISETVMVFDFKNVPISVCLNWDVNLLKKWFIIFQTYHVRIRFIAINALPIIEKMYNLVKIVLSKKMQSKILIYDEKNSYKLYESVPASLLPQEYHGTLANEDELFAKWKHIVESYHDWFKEDEKYRSYEELRVGEIVTHSDIFGVEGSFRKLDFD